MAIKAFVNLTDNSVGLQNAIVYDVSVWNEGTDSPVSPVQVWSNVTINMGSDIVAPYTEKRIHDAILANVVPYLALQGITVASSDVVFMYGPQQPATITRTFNNTPSRSIVTGTGATGFQVSATQDADVQYSPTMVTTASISGNASDVLVFEICSTNSATAGNWIEIGRLSNAQALTLAITLQSVQTTSGLLGGIIPAGYYAKIRAITSGTVTNTFVSGQEVLL